MSLMARLATRSAALLGMRLVGAALIFGMQAAMARLWGAELLGQYILIIACVNLIAVILPLGFQVIGNYFASEYSAHGQGTSLRRFALRAYIHIGVGTAVAFAFSPFIGPRLLGGASHMPNVLTSAILLAAATAAIFVNGALLVGLKRPIAGFGADTLLRPIGIIAAFAVAYTVAQADARLTTLLNGAALVCIAIAALHARALLIELRKLTAGDDDRQSEPRRWRTLALPWTILALATDFFFDIDLVLVAHMMSTEDLAVFGVCTRVFSLIAFGVAAIHAVTMPDAFETRRQHGDTHFHGKLAEANLMATALAVLAACAMTQSGPLLALFGPAFAKGALPLAILCLGLVARSVAGPAALVLSLHDRPYASLPAVALGLLTLVLCNVGLVPALGLTGAAIAATVAMTVWSAAQWFTAWRHTSVDVSVWPKLRELLDKPRLQ